MTRAGWLLQLAHADRRAWADLLCALDLAASDPRFGSGGAVVGAAAFLLAGCTGLAGSALHAWPAARERAA